MKFEDFLGIFFTIFVCSYIMIVYNILLNTKIGEHKND